MFKAACALTTSISWPNWDWSGAAHLTSPISAMCLRLATGAPWYVSNRQIQEDLGFPLYADNIRALTAGFDSKLANMGNPLLRQLGRYSERGLTPSPDAKTKGGRGQQASRGHRPRWPSRLNESRSALISRAPCGYPDRGFSVIFPQL